MRFFRDNFTKTLEEQLKSVDEVRDLPTADEVVKFLDDAGVLKEHKVIILNWAEASDIYQAFYADEAVKFLEDTGALKEHKVVLVNWVDGSERYQAFYHRINEMIKQREEEIYNKYLDEIEEENKEDDGSYSFYGSRYRNFDYQELREEMGSSKVELPWEIIDKEDK